MVFSSALLNGAVERTLILTLNEMMLTNEFHPSSLISFVVAVLLWRHRFLRHKWDFYES